MYMANKASRCYHTTLGYRVVFNALRGTRYIDTYYDGGPIIGGGLSKAVAKASLTLITHCSKVMMSG